jgi:hypothetical protein
MVEGDADDRTTPGLLRLPALAALGLLASYFVACFWYALDEEGKPLWSVWGNWQMFSVGGRHNNDLDAEAEIDGEWVALDLQTLFPSRFDSGPRYRQLRNRPGPWMETLADSACDRDPRHPTAIRLYDARWKLVPGEDPYLRKGVVRKRILHWKCDRVAKRPGGVVW